MPKGKWSTTRVVVWEMDRFSGKKEFQRLEFDDHKEAEDFVKEHNAQNNKDTVPDWYTYAEILG